ncbi:hypothetical protein BRM1_08150 [Brevibacterium sp. BRM-1]|uniref:hypothetical protein n=1 Tax=Brevibacterium sp. BRM-1 TaxID=2999062 RepID=UPI0022809A25|nr:hypothetical protein [Brevibacterium sp. BRM-1]WAL39259.1 hypothetical protein BRM1_08150 [Brevibacterium sp. BRM-1]
MRARAARPGRLGSRPPRKLRRTRGIVLFTVLTTAGLFVSGCGLQQWTQGQPPPERTPQGAFTAGPARTGLARESSVAVGDWADVLPDVSVRATLRIVKAAARECTDTGTCSRRVVRATVTLENRSAGWIDFGSTGSELISGAELDSFSGSLDDSSLRISADQAPRVRAGARGTWTADFLVPKDPRVGLRLTFSFEDDMTRTATFEGRLRG